MLNNLEIPRFSRVLDLKMRIWTSTYVLWHLPGFPGLAWHSQLMGDFKLITCPTLSKRDRAEYIAWFPWRVMPKEPSFFFFLFFFFLNSCLLLPSYKMASYQLAWKLGKHLHLMTLSSLPTNQPTKLHFYSGCNYRWNQKWWK